MSSVASVSRNGRSLLHRRDFAGWGWCRDPYRRVMRSAILLRGKNGPLSCFFGGPGISPTPLRQISRGRVSGFLRRRAFAGALFWFFSRDFAQICWRRPLFGSSLAQGMTGCSCGMHRRTSRSASLCVNNSNLRGRPLQTVEQMAMAVAASMMTPALAAVLLRASVVVASSSAAAVPVLSALARSARAVSGRDARP